MLEYLTNKY